MNIKELPAIEGELPDRSDPIRRFVVIGVTNGSKKSTRTILRLVGQHDQSEVVTKQLGDKYPDLTFKMLATGRIEKSETNERELILHRGTDAPWDFSLEGANLLCVAFSGLRVTPRSPSPHPEPPRAIPVHVQKRERRKVARR